MGTNWIKDYFTFTLKERIAVIILVLMIVCIFLMPKLLSWGIEKPGPQDIVQLDSISRIFKVSSKDSIQEEEQPLAHLEPSTPANSNEYLLFRFDPNTASSADWKRLGLREKTILTIQRYLSKGGHFNKAEDIGKIYGLRAEEYRRLLPFVSILPGAKDIQYKKSYKDTGMAKDPKLFSTPEYSKVKKELVSLNSADTAELVDLPGIGLKLASRIINFRNRLGGFYSVDQLAETYGLPDSTFQKIKLLLILGNTPVKKININNVDAARFKEHPYISWTVANALVQYRNQHGRFERVEDVGLVNAISPALLNKLIPYLSID